MKSCTKPTNISDKKRAHFLVSSGSNWGKEQQVNIL
jgi:hypothetical protein